MSLMSVPCPECQSIHLEFAEAWRSVRDALSDQRLNSESINSWLQRLDEDESRRTRETARLWQAWRRQREHRVLTGHYAPVVIAPGNAASQN
jgi:hypothetical protein